MPLGEVRAEEFRAAAVLGAERGGLLSYPDGNLAGVPEAGLAALAGDGGAGDRGSALGGPVNW
jgi:hypothetical protein